MLDLLSTTQGGQAASPLPFQRLGPSGRAPGHSPPVCSAGESLLAALRTALGGSGQSSARRRLCHTPPSRGRVRPDSFLSEAALESIPGSCGHDPTRPRSPDPPDPATERYFSGAQNVTAEDTTHAEITMCGDSALTWDGREELARSPGWPPSLWDRGGTKPQRCMDGAGGLAEDCGPWASLHRSCHYLHHGLSIPPPEETCKIWRHQSLELCLFMGHFKRGLWRSSVA